MKQVLKSIKRKYLVGGIAAFAGVSLLTTGVATWVIGANASTNKDVNVEVDSKSNNMATITIRNATKLKVGETADSDGEFVKVVGSDENNMKISLENITYTFGSSFTNSKVGLKLDIIYTYSEENGAAISNAGNLVSSSEFSRTSAKDAKLKKDDSTFTAWQYITVQPVINDIGSKCEGGNTPNVEHTIDKLDVTFNWGSFFGGEAPSAFYNGLKLSSAADATKVENELAAMQTALNAGIKITAELVSQE